MIINHSYKLPYKEVKYFKYEMYDVKEGIGVVAYEPYVRVQIPIIIKELNRDKNTRRAVLVMNRNTDFMSCLMNMQYQYYYNDLIVTVNLRSQAEEFVEKDNWLWNYITTKVIKGLDIKPEYVETLVNVGNFHSRTEICNSLKK